MHIDTNGKYEGSEEKDCGDEQFEIADTRSLKQMYDDTVFGVPWQDSAGARQVVVKRRERLC